MRVLISGAGIAGPTLAYWLAHFGFTPTLVEVAPSLRTSGYIIDFWGAGFDIADRMGMLPRLRDCGYAVREVKAVDAKGNRVAGFPAAAFSRMTHGRYVSLPRGELAAAIYEVLNGRVETIFGDSVDAMEQTGSEVCVQFRSGSTRSFDLVIGADGLHSRIRELAFGPEMNFEKYLGFKAAAFQVDGYTPRDELAYVMYTEVGQQVARFAMRENRTMFFFSFRDEEPDGPDNVADQKEALRKRFGSSGWECRRILDEFDAGSHFYFDRVSQIRMGQEPGSWTRDRVTLVGDAAFCVSLLAGQGSALAMTAAYVLAGELHHCQGDYAAAFRRYQDRFGLFVFRKQKAALRFADSFAPKSRLGLFLRNRIFNLLSIPWIANLAVGSDLADRITLPQY